MILVSLNSDWVLALKRAWGFAIKRAWFLALKPTCVLALKRAWGLALKRAWVLTLKTKCLLDFYVWHYKKILSFLPLMLLYCNLPYECVQLEIYSETDELWQTTHYL